MEMGYGCGGQLVSRCGWGAMSEGQVFCLSLLALTFLDQTRPFKLLCSLYLIPSNPISSVSAIFNLNYHLKTVIPDITIISSRICAPLVDYNPTVTAQYKSNHVSHSRSSCHLHPDPTSTLLHHPRRNARAPVLCLERPKLPSVQTGTKFCSSRRILTLTLNRLPTAKLIQTRL